MGSPSTPPTPDLPFPIFQISEKFQRYLLYDIDIITWLRKTHNILGVLIGTLPQIPQQNVFLGLPLELQPEEARLLVEKDLAYIVYNSEWHKNGLASQDATRVKSIKTDLRREGLKIAKESQRRKQTRTEQALRRSQGKENSDSGNSPSTDELPETKGESLFENPLKDEATPSPSIVEDQITPWRMTPTTSHSLLPSQSPPSEQNLPGAHIPSYALFKHLHDQGYFLTPGLRFGCQFSVYPGDPLRFHSHFLAMSYEWDEDIDLLDLVGGGRLATGVKKGWLIGGLEDDGSAGKGSPSATEEDKNAEFDESKVRTFCIEWGGM